MANQSWAGLLAGTPQGTGAGTALITAATAAISPQQNVTNQDYVAIQAGGNYFGWYPGLILRVEARGFLTTTGTSTTATIFLRSNRLNNGNAFVTLATANGITTGTSVITGIQWKVSALIRCTAIASTGSTVSTQGELTLANSGAAVPANPIALTGTSGVGPLSLPNISGENAAAVDTTVLQGIQLAGTLAGANATIQCTQWIVEALC